ncbi:putative E2F-DP heterodimerization region [Helianthus annuus]|nr:putative E2F-DP heterodimerization region [Helianthus annuus]
MGKKGGWLSTVQKAISHSDSSEKKDKEETLIAIKASHGTTVEVPDSDEVNLRM